MTLQCWNGRDAGRYTNTVVNDGLQHQEYNPEVPVDLSRYPGDAQINQQIRALKSITQKIENAHKGLDVEWPVEGQPGDGNNQNIEQEMRLCRFQICIIRIDI